MPIALPVAVSAKDWQEGPADAPVTLVEYGDFQSGDCREAYLVLKRLRVEYAGSLRFVFRHLPRTDMHPQALDAARAAEAAGDAGQFWAMHDALFEAPAALSSTEIRDCAAKAGLDVEGVLSRVAAPDTYEAVRADVDGIRATGIQKSPALFLNGLQYEGAVTWNALSEALQTESA